MEGFASIGFRCPPGIIPNSSKGGVFSLGVECLTPLLRGVVGLDPEALVDADADDDVRDRLPRALTCASAVWVRKPGSPTVFDCCPSVSCTSKAGPLEPLTTLRVHRRFNTGVLGEGKALLLFDFIALISSILPGGVMICWELPRGT